MRDANQHKTLTKAELEVAGAKAFSVPKTFQAQGARRTTGAGANILTTGKVSRFSFQRKKGTDHRGRAKNDGYNELPSQHKATNDASGKDAKKCVKLAIFIMLLMHIFPTAFRRPLYCKN